MDPSRTSLEAALAGHGLRLRGGWIPAPDDVLPALHGGRPAAVVWMVGQVGAEVWAAFAASPFLSDGLPDPLDRWSKSIGDRLAADLGGAALYPSDGPPWAPFQQWAVRTESVQGSPLMLLIHPEFGLWHAYRFALALPALTPQDAALLQAPRPPAPDLCLHCDGQPCLAACPVDAFSARGYAVDRCADFLRQPAGQDCMQAGCQARRACPVGAAHRYTPQHAAFHMAAFARGH